MATPRTTRANSRTPLPAIGAKQSHAYGAEGKTDLKAQVRSSGADFGSAFAATRAASGLAEVAEEEDDEEDGRSDAPSLTERVRPSRRAGRGRQESARVERRAAMPPPPPPPPAADISSRPSTGLGSMVQYGATFPAGVTERRQPSKYRVFNRAFPRYVIALFRPTNANIKATILEVLMWLSFAISTLAVLAWMPLPAKLYSIREDVCFQMKMTLRVHPWELPPRQIEHAWYQFKTFMLYSRDIPAINLPEQQWFINRHTLDRIDGIERRLVALEDTVKSHNETIRAINELLPDTVSLRVVNGKYEIPGAFWSAVEERLTAENDLAPLWTAYVTQNADSLEAHYRGLIASSVNGAIELRELVSKEEFVLEIGQKIEENNDLIRQQYRSEVKDVAVRSANEVFDKSPAGQFGKVGIERLARAAEWYNTMEKMTTINHFSIGAGARVDPMLTSPTRRVKALTWLGKLLHRIPEPWPPIMALQDWSEATQCWCGALTAEGDMQITILQPKKTFADTLVLEHVPASGTSDTMAAPQDIELWAVLESKSAAKAINKLMPDNSWPHDECSKAPSKYHVCIAKGTYDIHNWNWVQHFETFVYTDRLGLAANKYTIKVTKNWGGNYTCIYRLRMTGELAVPDPIQR